jgi:Cu/Ag efflux protein CusF
LPEIPGLHVRKEFTMKLSSCLFVILLASTVSASSVLSADKAVSVKQKQVTGNVTELDIAAHTITITKKSKKVVLGLGDKTDVIQCTHADISDIKIGDKVTARYKETSGKNAARSITIRGK